MVPEFAPYAQMPLQAPPAPQQPALVQMPGVPGYDQAMVLPIVLEHVTPAEAAAATMASELVVADKSSALHSPPTRAHLVSHELPSSARNHCETGVHVRSPVLLWTHFAPPTGSVHVASSHGAHVLHG